MFWTKITFFSWGKPEHEVIVGSAPFFASFSQSPFRPHFTLFLKALVVFSNARDILLMEMLVALEMADILC